MTPTSSDLFDAKVLHVVGRCRSDLHTVLQWGTRSLDELHDVVDETMADELVCMIREKMLRILSDMADFEDAAEDFERTMTQGASAAASRGDRGRPESSGSAPQSDDNADVIPERLPGVSSLRNYQCNICRLCFVICFYEKSFVFHSFTYFLFYLHCQVPPSTGGAIN